MHPGGPKGFLELGQTHNVDVDELHHLVSQSGAAGLVPHHPPHDPTEDGKQCAHQTAGTYTSVLIKQHERRAVL